MRLKPILYIVKQLLLTLLNLLVHVICDSLDLFVIDKTLLLSLVVQVIVVLLVTTHVLSLCYSFVFSSIVHLQLLELDLGEIDVMHCTLLHQFHLLNVSFIQVAHFSFILQLFSILQVSLIHKSLSVFLL